MLSLQRKPKLGRTELSTVLHAAQGPRVGHSCSRYMEFSYNGGSIKATVENKSDCFRFIKLFYWDERTHKSTQSLKK